MLCWQRGQVGEGRVPRWDLTWTAQKAVDPRPRRPLGECILSWSGRAQVTCTREIGAARAHSVEGGAREKRSELVRLRNGNDRWLDQAQCATKPSSTPRLARPALPQNEIDSSPRTETPPRARPIQTLHPANLRALPHRHQETEPLVGPPRCVNKERSTP